jgi:hypothetical protein
MLSVFSGTLSMLQFLNFESLPFGPDFPPGPSKSVKTQDRKEIVCQAAAAMTLLPWRKMRKHFSITVATLLQNQCPKNTKASDRETPPTI